MEKNQNSHHKKDSAGFNLDKIESTLDLYLIKKAPAMPHKWKEVLVKILPWFIIIGGVFAVLGLFSLLGTLTTGGIDYFAIFGPLYFVSYVLNLVIVGIELYALPRLFARKREGWNLLFYASLINVVNVLLTIGVVGSGILVSILFLVIGFYLLFQIKELYK